MVYLTNYNFLANIKNDEVQVENGYDPGECSEINYAKLKLVLDRQDDNKLMICLRYNDQYIWQSVDGMSIRQQTTAATTTHLFLLKIYKRKGCNN